MADRQQHIDSLARAIDPVAWSEHALSRGAWEEFRGLSRRQAAAIFDSTDPRLHDALTAALHANADRARVLAGHADHGWLDKEAGWAYPTHDGHCRRYVSDWEAQ